MNQYHVRRSVETRAQANREHLMVKLLGVPQVFWSGKALPLKGKRLALLCYLAAEQRPATRSELSVLLWNTTRRTNIRTELKNLRRLPGASTWLYDEEDAPIAISATTDLEQFKVYLAEEDYAAAITLWREAGLSEQSEAHFLHTLEHSGLPQAFDEWLFEERERVNGRYREVLQSRAYELEMRGELDAALSFARDLLSRDALNESVHQMVMRIELARGRVDRALAQFEVCRQTLLKELKVKPLPSTLELYESAQQTAEERRRAKRTLPPQATAFVGRTQELTALRDALKETRLLNLLGPGGVGKTRLALQAATQSAANFADGTFFVDLAPLMSVQTIVPAIAEAAGLQFSGSAEPKEQLEGFLQRKEALLLLDNFEHLLAGAALLTDLLAACPKLKLLVTSRERLELSAEGLFEVAGLSYPERADDPDFTSYDAVQFFMQRARQTRPSFTLQAGDEVPLLEICRFTGGLPLALELLAPWVRLLPLTAIAAELGTNADLFATASQDLPERHRNMRFVFERSFARLSEDEKKILAKLAIFRGGFSREAAKEVAGATLLNLLSLADKSLIRRGEGERFEMLEVVRQFAAARLEGEEATLRDMANYYRSFAEKFKEQHSILRSEENNILAALTAASTQRLGELHLQLVLQTHRFLNLRGYNLLAKVHLKEAERHARTSATSLHLTELLHALGINYRETGEAKRGIDYLSEALRLAESFSQMTEQRDILISLGVTHLSTGDLPIAAELYQQALAISQTLGEQGKEAHLLSNLGVIYHHEGEFERAASFYERAISIFRQVGNKRLEGSTLSNLGVAYTNLAKPSEALETYQKALNLLIEVGDRRKEGNCLANMGVLLHEQDRLSEALLHFQKALTISREIGNREGEQGYLDCVGATYRKLGDTSKAIAYHRQALSICLEIDYPYGEASCLKNMGSAYLEAGELLKAVSVLVPAYAIFSSMQMHEEEETLDLLLDCKKFGSFEKALQKLALDGDAILSKVMTHTYTFYRDMPSTLIQELAAKLEARR